MPLTVSLLWVRAKVYSTRCHTFFIYSQDIISRIVRVCISSVSIQFLLLGLVFIVEHFSLVKAITGTGTWGSLSGGYYWSWQNCLVAENGWVLNLGKPGLGNGLPTYWQKYSTCSTGTAGYNKPASINLPAFNLQVLHTVSFKFSSF